MECKSCGATINHRDAFCSLCGELTRSGQPLDQKLKDALFEFGEELSKLAGSAAHYVTDGANRKQVIGGGVALFIAILAIVLFDTQSSDDMAFAWSEPQTIETYEDRFLSDPIETFTTGPANIRNYPTAEQSNVVLKVEEGFAISGRWVQGLDPTTKWLKLYAGKGYIWEGNLAGPLSMDAQSDALAAANAAVEAVAEADELQKGPAFPSSLQGRWSSMDTCRGADLNMVITISAQKIQFYESVGRLTKISYDYKERELYHLKMRGEGEEWDRTLRLLLTANGNSMILKDESDPNYPDEYYHNPQAGCSKVFFYGE